MKKITIIVILFSIVLVQNLFADEVSHRKLAEEFLLILNMDKQTKEMFNQMKKIQTDTVREMGGSEAAESFQDKMFDLMVEEMSWENLKDDYIEVYTEVLAEEELRELINFYKSPIGQRYVEKTPELIMKAMEIGKKHSAQIMPRMQQMMMEQIQEKTKEKTQEQTQE